MARMRTAEVLSSGVYFGTLQQLCLQKRAHYSFASCCPTSTTSEDAMFKSSANNTRRKAWQLCIPLVIIVVVETGTNASSRVWCWWIPHHQQVSPTPTNKIIDLMEFGTSLESASWFLLTFRAVVSSFNSEEIIFARMIDLFDSSIIPF